MADKSENPEELTFEELELIGKHELRCSFCIACGSEMFRSHMLICADCLGDKCEDFLKTARGEDEEAMDTDEEKPEED